MRNISYIAIAAALVFAPVASMAQTVPPTTVNAPQSTNNGVSNPVGQNTNVQVNNSYAGMNSFGVGIECATPYLAAGVFNNNTTVGGGIASASNANNNSLGGTLQFVVPIGGKQQSNCTALSDEIVHQHQLDTQITLIQRCADLLKAGIKVDATRYPEIAAACDGVHVSAVPATTAALPMTPTVQTVTVPKLVVYREPAQAAPKCRSVSSPNARERKLAQAIKDAAHGKLSRKGATLVAEYMRELQSSCLTPVAMVQVLEDR